MSLEESMSRLSKFLAFPLSMLLPFLGNVSQAQSPDELFKKCYVSSLPDQVISSCSWVIARDSVDRVDLATAYKNRGNAYDDKGEYERALEDYERALAINPADADAFNSRGTTYTALERYDLAIRDFDEAMKLNPSSPIALSNRCFAKAVSGELEQALADCDEALRMRRRNPGTRASRGFVNLKLKRYEAAIDDYSAELRDRPDDPFALFGRAAARYMKGDLRGSDNDVVAAQSIKPDIAEFMARLGVRINGTR